MTEYPNRLRVLEGQRPEQRLPLPSGRGETPPLSRGECLMVACLLSLAGMIAAYAIWVMS